MGRRRTRRQSHGSAWHWKQTDCWYYTLPRTKKRAPLFDDNGQRIRGVENKKAAQLALARIKLVRRCFWREIQVPVRDACSVIIRAAEKFV